MQKHVFAYLCELFVCVCVYMRSHIHLCEIFMCVCVCMCVYMCQYLQDDEELIPWLSLHHDLLPVLKLHRLQGVGHCQALPFVQRL